MFARKMAAVLAITVGLLFVAAYAVQAYDNYGEGTHGSFFYTGQITGINPHYKVITVKAGPGDESYFEVRDDSSLMSCGSYVSFKDLKIGELVTITFFSESLGGSRFVADLNVGMKC